MSLEFDKDGESVAFKPEVKSQSTAQKVISFGKDFLGQAFIVPVSTEPVPLGSSAMEMFDPKFD